MMQGINNLSGSFLPQNNFQPYANQQFSVVQIQGRMMAEDYPVAPGAKVILIDTQELVTYVKERDVQGRSLPFRIYDWVIREEQQAVTEKPEIEPATIDYEKIKSMIAEEVKSALGPQTESSKQSRVNKKEK